MPRGSRFMRAMTSPRSRSARRYRRVPVALKDLIALVALLVALVHHRGSYSVTLGNRRGMLRSPRRTRGFLRWRVTERDWLRPTDRPCSGLKIWGPGPG
jgi:hypothetical protein